MGDFYPFTVPVLPNVPPVIGTVQQNSIPKLKSLIKEGVDVNAVDKNGFTALHYAACNGQNKMMQELLLAGADRTVVSDYKQLTALYLAIVKRHKSCISLLLSEKFIVAMNDGNGEEMRNDLQFVVNQPSTQDRMVPLNVACVLFPSVDVLLELLQAGARLTDCYNSNGYLPIHCASFFCSREVVELLLEWGANPESLTSGNTPKSAPPPLKRIGFSLTPLACASLALNKEAFNALMRAGADLDTCTSSCNGHLLEIVCQNLHDGFRKDFFESASLRWIMPAKKEKTIDMLTSVLEIPDVKIDHQNTEGDTALHIASQARCKKGVELLLDVGADATLKNVIGGTPAEVTSDPKIRTLLEPYESGSSARVVECESNASLTQSSLQAIGFTGKKQSLLTSKGVCIGAGSRNADTGIIGQPKASHSKDQSSGTSLTIPENSLSKTVAVTLNYTPNPPVLIYRQNDTIQSAPTNSGKDDQTEQTGQRGSKIVQFSLPVTDLSKNAEETVISPFVTVTANHSVALAKEGHVAFPHCAQSTQANQSTSESEKANRQFAITIKEQSLTEGGHITDWRTIHESKVKCTEDQVTVSIDKIEQASTYVAVATSTTGQPIREVMKKSMQFWILGNPMLKRQMHVAAVCCTNAYRPAKLVAQLQEDSSLKLQPWYPGSYPVIAEKNIKVEMSTLEMGWAFEPASHLVEKDVVSSPGAIFPYFFCLDCEERELKRICCSCSLEYDGNERKLAFYTSEKAGRKEQEPLSPAEEEKTESEHAEALASPDQQDQAVRTTTLDESERKLPEKVVSKKEDHTSDTKGEMADHTEASVLTDQRDQTPYITSPEPAIEQQHGGVESETHQFLDLDKSLFDLEQAIRVVARFCSDSWLLFGVALGYSQPEVKNFGHPVDDLEGKLELVIRGWMDDKGKKATVGALLDACGQFRRRGRVEQELKKILGIRDTIRQSKKDTQVDFRDLMSWSCNIL